MTRNLAGIVAGLLLLDLLTLPGLAADSQVVLGHVPAALAKLNLQPLGRLPANQEMRISINLPLRNTDEMVQLCREIYNPASTNYQQYLKPREFTEKFGPTVEDYQAVVNFAKANGLTVEATTPGRSLLNVKASVADIERVLHVKMYQYQHPTEARRFFAPDVEPALDLATPVARIGGLNNFAIPHPLGSRQVQPRNQGSSSYGGANTNGTGAYGWYLGKDYRNAYVPGTSLTGQGEVAGLVEFQGYDPNDIQTYENLAGYSSVTLSNVLLDGITVNSAGTLHDGGNSGEISGDIEMIIAMAPGLLNLVVCEGDFDNDASGDNVFEELGYPSHGEPMPYQISCSWGFSPDNITSNKFIRFAMQGQTYFAASGDGGAFAGPNWSGGPATFCGAEPYQIFVGGTELYMSPKGGSWQGETVWHDHPDGGDFASSGGLFTGVAIPDYQKTINMAKNQGSMQFLNVPDVAAVAVNIEIVLSDFPTNGPIQRAQPQSWLGTSFASPLWAGFTALINQQAVAQGRPRVGFLNPALYGIGQGPQYTNCFHDIIVGNNTWSNSPNAYYATNGYDLCTGWGTPNGNNLINELMSWVGPVFVNFHYTGPNQNGSYDTPFSTLAKGTNAVPRGGTIIFDATTQPSVSGVTIQISKPMNFNSIGGPTTIGQ